MRINLYRLPDSSPTGRQKFVIVASVDMLGNRSSLFWKPVLAVVV